MQSYYMNTLLFIVAMLAVLFFAENYINAGQSLSLPGGEVGSVEIATSEAPDEDPLMGHRSFDANMRFGQLTFHGAAFTFQDLDETDGFAPYNFAFRTDRFTQTPRMGDTLISSFYARHKSSFSDNSGVLTDTCVNPREDNNISADGLVLTSPILCMIASDVPNRQLGMIGVVQPADSTVRLENGDATCRAEIAHWRTLPAFTNISIIICAVVDKPFDPDARRAEDWMDVIFFQQFNGTQLLNMRATTRNFQSIRGA